MPTTDVFDDVAFFFVLYAVVGLIVVPVTAYWVLGWLSAKLFSKAPDTAGDAAAPAAKPGEAAAAGASAIVRHINVKAGAAGIAPGAVCKCAECQRKRRSLEAEKRAASATRYLTPGWVVFGLLWVLFAYLTLQVPTYQGSQMVQFEPFQVLGLDHSATEREISKAYRKLSLQYHPDKNPGDAEAAQKFLLVSKAYQSLTDPQAQENMRKYGNPDGYQGSRVGIGLPKWLVDGANANLILVVYFIGIIVLPSAVVFWWWRGAKQFHESGVMKETVGAFYQFLPDTVSVKYLIELLAASAEYRSLDKTPTDPVLFRKLIAEVKDAMVKQKFPHAYIFKANHLLHAYMMRVVQCVPIADKPEGQAASAGKPAEKEDDDPSDVNEISNDLVNLLSKNKHLQADLRLVLRPVHRLLHTMYEMSLARGFTKTALCVIELMQLLTQAMWVHDSPLRQLPHLTDKEIRFAAKKGFNDLNRFRTATDKDRAKVFRDHSDAEWDDIMTVAHLLPDVEVEHKHEVEDEKGLYEGDVVLLTITLTRANVTSVVPTAKPTVTATATATAAPAATATPAAADAKTDGAATTTAADGKAAPATDAKAAGDSKAAPADGAAKKEEDVEDEDEDDDKIFALAQRPEKKRVTEESDLVDAHAVRFPFPKKERWYVILIATDVRGREIIIAQEKILNFHVSSTVKMRFQAPPKGTYQYELHVKCDSYVGCDRQSTVRIVVEENPAKAKARAKKLAAAQAAAQAAATGAAPPAAGAGAGDDDDDDEDGGVGGAELDDGEVEDAEEAPEPKWYYLWHTSFWELLLNAVVLSIAGFLLYDWMQKRGYWDAYVDPILQRVLKFLSPVISALQPVYASVVAPVLAWLDKVTTRSFKSEG